MAPPWSRHDDKAETGKNDTVTLDRTERIYSDPDDHYFKKHFAELKSSSSSNPSVSPTQPIAPRLP